VSGVPRGEDVSRELTAVHRSRSQVTCVLHLLLLPSVILCNDISLLSLFMSEMEMGQWSLMGHSQ